jgi:hypothetical protein
MAPSAPGAISIVAKPELAAQEMEGAPASLSFLQEHRSAAASTVKKRIRFMIQSIIFQPCKIAIISKKTCFISH